MVSALGLWNTSNYPGVYPLSETTPNTLHTFRSSFLVSFRGYLALERLSCDPEPTPSVVQHQAGQLTPRPGTSSNAKKFVRIRVSPLAASIYKFGLLTSFSTSNRSVTRQSQYLDAPLVLDQRVPSQISRHTYIRTGLLSRVISLGFADCKMSPTQRVFLTSTRMFRRETHLRRCLKCLFLTP